MKLAPACIAAGLALASAGCVLSGRNAKKPAATPAAVRPAAPPSSTTPPQPLSIPQTQVELPRPQPVDPAALSPNTPPPAEATAPAPVQRPPARPRPERRVEPPAAQPAAQPAVAEQAQPQIQEIISPAETRRLQDEAQARRRDVEQMLDQLRRRRLNAAQRNVITNINAFLISSLDAEKRGDMKLADALADRAQVLAKDLIDGK
jgi:outer membrane biosynthesis protein TonB